jgi:isopenicillin N synthase-like dioxygenase
MIAERRHQWRGTPMSDPLVANNVSPNQLPIIDVSGLSSSKRERREAVGEAIRSACIDKGFFYIANHGVPQGLIDAAMAETKNFFDLPVEARSPSRSRNATAAGSRSVPKRSISTRRRT